MSYFKPLEILFFGIGFMSSCHATNISLNSEDRLKLQQIAKKYHLPDLTEDTEDHGQIYLTPPMAEEIVRECPNVAKKIIQDNTLELSHFDEYSIGIPSHINLSLEKKRLEEEIKIFEVALEQLSFIFNKEKQYF